MKTFSEPFQTLHQRERIKQFWTLVIHFDFGDVYCASYPWIIAGNAHEAIIKNWGELASLVDREEKIFNLPSVQIDFNNFPVLSTGDRFSDLLQGTVETTQATIYCNFQDKAGNLGQAPVFFGIIQTPVAGDYQTAKITLFSLSEYYLDQAALRVLTRQDFPNLRDADVGSTVPIVVGQVPRVPGRVTKGSSKSKPFADGANTSNAELLDYTMLPAAVDQDWTAEFSPTEMDAYLGPFDGEDQVGQQLAAVTFDNADSASTGAGTASSLSKSFTCSGNLIIVAVSAIQSDAPGRFVQSIQYGGVTMTPIGGANVARIREPQATITLNGIGGELYLLAFPPTGANNVDVVVNSAACFAISIISFFNAAVESTWFKQSSNQAAISQDIQRSYGQEIYLSFLAKTNVGSAPTPLAGGIQRASVTTTQGGTNLTLRSETRPGVDLGTTSPGWNTGSTSASQILFAIRLASIYSIRAQSFTVGTNQTVAGVKLKIRRNPSTPNPFGGEIIAGIRLCNDLSGVPDVAGNFPSLLAPSIGGADLTLTSVTTSGLDIIVTLRNPVDVTPGIYWWVVLMRGNGTGGVLWMRSTAGTYSGGNAQKGLWNPLQGGGPFPFRPNRANAIQWQGGLSAQDFGFETIYATGAYSLYGTVAGFAGTGDIESSSVFNNEIQIDPQNWQGEPAGGDKFYFSINRSQSEVTLAESPPATPNKSIDTVYYGDTPLGNSLSGVVVNIPVASIDESIGSGGAVIGETFRFKETVLLKRMTFKLKKAGGPPGTVVNVALSVANRAGTAPDETAGSIATDSILISQLTNAYQDMQALANQNIVLLANVPYAVTLANPDSGSSIGNEVLSASDLVTAYPDGNRFLKNDSLATWGTNSTKDICMTIEVVTITKSISVLDVTGKYVSKLSLDTDIPDGVNISAGVTGITDDATGIYTGTPNALVIRPDLFIHWLMNFWSIDDALLDLAGSFADAATSYGGLYRFDGAAIESQTRKELLLQLGFESRSAPSWETDLFSWSFLPVKITVSDVTIVKRDIVIESKLPLIKFDHSDITKLVNFVDVRFRRRFTEGRSLTSYDKTTNAQNLASIEGSIGNKGYGKRENPDMFTMDFIRSSAMADDVALYYAERLSNPRRIVEFSTKLHRLSLETDDSINFDLS